MEAKSPATGFRLYRLHDDGISKRAAQSLAKPGDDPAPEDQGPTGSQGDQHLANRGQAIADYDQQLAVPEFVGNQTGDHLGETGHGIGSALDHSQDGRRQTEDRQKSWQNDRGGFITEITQRAGASGAYHGAINPALRLTIGIGFDLCFRSIC
jgi:hypothetical protein